MEVFNMKRFLIPLLALLLLCLSLTAAAAEEQITLEVNTEKLPLYAADDPYIARLRGTDEQPGDGLQVLVLPVRRGLQIQTAVKPATVKNKRVTLTVDQPDLVRVQGNSLNGLRTGETVLTIASVQDPAVTVQYRVLVIQQPNHITLTAAEKSVPVGGTVALSSAFVPAETTLQQVAWSSMDERIATVDENGVVTGLKRGNARIMATALDGSNVRANLSIQVVQLPVEIALSETEFAVAAGRNVMLRATVLPNDANDKNVLWSSSDESVATVNAQGRVNGIALGDCEIICTSKATGKVQAKGTVHLQQPVTSIAFGEAPAVYAGETAQLTWTVEPANASNPTLKLTSDNPRVLQVSEDGTVTGVNAGETWVNAISTDGTNRRARVRVKVYQHVTGVQMKRSIAYIDVGQTNTTGAVLEPKNATNHRMTWEIADPSIASIEPLKNEPHRLKITGLRAGETVLTGTTEDGGHQASMTVLIGNFDYALSLVDAYVSGADVYLTVRNDSDLTITSVTAEVSVLDVDGNPVPANSQDGSNTFQVVYRKTLKPGASTHKNDWKYVNFKLPDSPTTATYVVRITQFQINNDWVKTIMRKHQPVKKCPVHI